FFFSSRRRHTRFSRDWSSDVCSSDLQFQDQVRQERINNTRFVSPYNSNTTYQLNNMVSFNGHSFIAKKQTKGNPPPTDVTVVTEDRKSTRLNSSHVKISYAVFCLKKK